MTPFLPTPPRPRRRRMWLLMLLVLFITSPPPGGANCPADTWGKGCKNKCKCVSPVTKRECACASIKGECDVMCMEGLWWQERPESQMVTGVALLSGMGVVILIAVILLIVNRDRMNPKFPHRTAAAVRISMDMDQVHLTPIGKAASKTLVFDYTTSTDYKSSLMNLATTPSSPSLAKSSRSEEAAATMHPELQKALSRVKEESSDIKEAPSQEAGPQVDKAPAVTKAEAVIVDQQETTVKVSQQEATVKVSQQEAKDGKQEVKDDQRKAKVEVDGEDFEGSASTTSVIASLSLLVGGKQPLMPVESEQDDPQQQQQ